MALIFHERVGLDGRRISPFSWRIRYAFAHKGLQPTVVPRASPMWIGSAP